MPVFSPAPIHAPLHRRAWLSLGATVIAAALLLAAGCSDKQGGQVSAVTLETARADLEAGRVTLFDIREPEEHATGVAAGAHLLPMSQINQRIGEIPKDPAKPVLLICNTQNRSQATAQALIKHGYTNVQYVKGGMSEWGRRGWPLVRPGT